MYNVYVTANMDNHLINYVYRLLCIFICEQFSLTVAKDIISSHVAFWSKLVISSCLQAAHFSSHDDDADADDNDRHDHDDDDDDDDDDNMMVMMMMALDWITKF